MTRSIIVIIISLIFAFASASYLFTMIFEVIEFEPEMGIGATWTALIIFGVSFYICGRTIEYAIDLFQKIRKKNK